MSRIQYTIPKTALDELESIRLGGWTFRLSDLVEFVNSSAERFLPITESTDGRLRKGMSERTLRHYQTLGCIDPPRKEGRDAFYGYRQYLQSLLIRKLLFEGYSSDQIKETVQNLTDEGLLDLLLRNVEIFDISSTHSTAPASGAEPPPSSEWLEIELEPGLIIKVCKDSSNTSDTTSDHLKRAADALAKHR